MTHDPLTRIAFFAYGFGVGMMICTTVAAAISRRKRKEPIHWEMAIIALILCFGSWATVLLLTLARRAMAKEMMAKLSETIASLEKSIQADKDKAATEATKQSDTNATA